MEVSVRAGTDDPARAEKDTSATAGNDFARAATATAPTTMTADPLRADQDKPLNAHIEGFESGGAVKAGALNHAGGVTRSGGVARSGGLVSDKSIAAALAMKATTAAVRKERKEERLRREKEAADRRNLQAARMIENSSKKRSRERDTIRRFFTASRNFDNVAASTVIGSESQVNEEVNPPNSALMPGAPLNTTDASPNIAEAPSSTDPNLAPDVSKSTASLDALSRVESSNVEILAASAPPITLSTDSSAALLSEDDPDWHRFHGVSICGLADEDSEEDEYLDMPPPPKRMKKNYDLTRRFQIEWSATCPWSEMILTDEGLLHIVKCSICSAVRGRPIIMGPKFDTVKRHGKRVCHLKNVELYAARRPTTVLQQIQGCTTTESRKKVSYFYFFSFACYSVCWKGLH
jgi:hypothetical protein